uniref:Uncharacterized protein n=1 Tax=Ixodes ricinus TaxID=34613 RepID=V5IGV9_IXORI
MNPKTILCTFGEELYNGTVGPQDGVCDIIIFDFLYAAERGTFLNHTPWLLRWFLDYVKDNTGTTEFGLGIDHR